MIRDTRSPHGRERDRPARRLGDVYSQADGTPYVTARILTSTNIDGSPLDAGTSLDYCGTDASCTVSLAMKDGQPEYITSTAAGSSTAAAAGGAGSGGVYPFAGGLPLNIPKIPGLTLPTLPKWLYWAAGGVAALLLVEGKRR